uniref:Leucine-rich repeat protein kinase-like n=1 Tax=Oryza sativa subsp. japonica TaxID=39947 RepID=Q6ES05_ORYSJ|nr:leucine-rich repeat protein kinase-like [Oryza sativa Japonica Group]BAD28565.1 leucine-rich repeat protein kinase-like [Oryza sativa Japonica Group]
MGLRRGPNAKCLLPWTTTLAPETCERRFGPIDTIMAIKIEYGIKKNWMGDPCFPTEFAWNDDPTREPEHESASASINNHGDVLQKVESRQFTYKELEKLTNHFEQFIGQGGFGSVYYGCLEDGTEIAVKMRSDSSSHGLDEFFAEVLNSAESSKFDKGNNVVGEGLNWRTRVRVVVEAAQERVCDLFSRVKCRDWEPKLTESSDVYSFGVVLLEIAIGESPILPELSHIVHRVKNKIATGNISLVADTRLRGSYEVSSMWKVVDTALLCTTDIGTQRPTMAAVVALLKESLALEETRADSTFSGATGTASASTTSSMNFGPLARRS